MTHHQGFLNAWLKDAYSMEMGLVPILENHAKDAKDYPQMQQVIQQHAERTKQHAEMVKQCLERLGDKPSSLKASIGGIMGSAQSVATGAAEDELVKNGLMDFASENFEIASYKALIAAAEQMGDTQTVQVCQQILRDEEQMARWLETQLPTTVREANSTKFEKENK
jgi:ferritin-like metal-binding protein YciE